VQLLGELQNQPFVKTNGRTRLPPARWEYAAGGSGFRAIRGNELTPWAAGAFVSQTRWDTASLRAGPVRLRLRFGDGRFARSQFILDRPPGLAQPRASFDPSSGQTTLSAVMSPGGSAHAAQSEVAVKWYLGDGTTATGPSTSHRYQPGDYVVTVEVRDGAGCVTRRVVLLHLPENGQATVTKVDWCDPLGGAVRAGGQSMFAWPPDVGLDPNAKAPPQKVTLGRRHDAGHPGYAVAFGFEPRVHVLGDPDRCVASQIVRAHAWWEQDRSPRLIEWVSPFHGTGYEDDGPVARFRQVQPNADGTSTISWLDFPGVQFDENVAYKSAQVLDLFYVWVTGQEAPIHHVETEGGGETSFLHFAVCAAWNPPAGTRDSNFRVLDRGGPDAPLPTDAQPGNIRTAGADVVFGPAGSLAPGCGP
jgi:hypothetical protein